MQTAIEFLKNKGITKATCYTDSSKTYYVNELAELMEEYAALRQPPVSGSLQDRLFELANDFAVAKKGEVAVKLHSIHNGLQ